MMTISTESIISEVISFENQLKYGNRFFVEHRVVDILTKKFAELVIDISEGKELFRARIDYKQEVLKENIKYSHYLAALARDHIYEQTDEHIQYFNEQYAPSEMEKIKERLENGFLGFDEKGSFIPPITSLGRAQPKHVRYLYTAEDYETAVAEVQPRISHYVSVAKIQTTEPLKVVDLSIEKKYLGVDEIVMSLVDFEQSLTKEEILDSAIFQVVVQLFSTPNNDEDAYILPNYICALIHKLGYDGVRYSSTVHKGGKNITLFHDKCKCISSCLLQVQNFKISTTMTKVTGVNAADVVEYTKHLQPNPPVGFLEMLSKEQSKEVTV